MPFKIPPIVIDQMSVPPEILAGPEWYLADYSLHEPVAHMGEGIRWGIVDTGMDPQHAAGDVFAGAILEMRDFTGSASGTRDYAGHGTSVAQVVGGRGNLPGVAPKVELLIAKGLDDQGSGQDGWLDAALTWCVTNGCHGINCSWGASLPSARITARVKWANEKGVICVFAAGNSGPDSPEWPASQEEGIAQGAIDRRKLLANFSSTGNYVDAVGPGVKMRMAGRNGSVTEASGTSFAAPWLSGLLARRLSAELAVFGEIRTKGSAGVNALLATACDDLGTGGRDPEYGHGVPLPKKFLAVAAPEPPAPPTPGPGTGFWLGPLHFPSMAGGVASLHLERLTAQERVALKAALES